MMARYYAGRTAPASFTAPPGLVTAELDRATGQLADAMTPPERRYTEYFVPGTEPEPLRSVPWKAGIFGALIP
jgi:penicillin-binding protein 1A